MNDVRELFTTPVTRVTVLGAARSGIAAARFFIDRNIPVFISEQCSAEKCSAILARNNLAMVPFEAGGHTSAVLASECIIVSPGIPSDIPVLVEARARGIAVWSEMELGFRASSAPFLAVTGSTGKSTTVSLAGSVLAAAGIEHVVAGNIGLPVIASTPSVSENGFVVAEVSSFQLETIETFHPHAAVIMNFMKNHLDRYPSEEAYYDAKKEIVRNATSDDFLIVNAGDVRLFTWASTLRDSMKVIAFGADVAGMDAFWIEKTLLKYRFNRQTGSIGDLSSMKLRGMHNYQNASVAAALGMIAGAQERAIMQGLCSFGGLAHRLEYVTRAGGVSWYNDSKSTTAESIVCAVESFSDGVVLIAGGKDKGCDFAVVEQSLKKQVRQVILIGEAAERMQHEWEAWVPVVRATTLVDAIEKASACAVPGNAVVFSPGCSSFDMFRDYEDRGEQFCKEVRNMVAAESGAAHE